MQGHRGSPEGVEESLAETVAEAQTLSDSDIEMMTGSQPNDSAVEAGGPAYRTPVMSKARGEKMLPTALVPHCKSKEAAGSDGKAVQ